MVTTRRRKMRRKRDGGEVTEKKTEGNGELSAGMRLGDQRKRGGVEERKATVCVAPYASGVGGGWKKKTEEREREKERERHGEEERETVNATCGTRETEEIVGEGREGGEGSWGRGERKGMSDEDRGCMDEGLMRDAGYGTRRGTIAWGDGNEIGRAHV